MSMVLTPEHISTIGRVNYHGVGEYESVADIVLIEGSKTNSIALALRFGCNSFVTSLLRREHLQDPCDKEMLDKYARDLVETAYHYPLFGYLETHIFPDVNMLEGDGKWTYSYGYGTCDKSLYHRYLFGHPSDESVDTGDFGKHLMFGYRRLETFLTINTGEQHDDVDHDGLDTDA